MAAEVVPASGAAARPPLVLPVLLFGVPEIHRVARDLEALEAYIQQTTIRQGAGAALPKVSRGLDALAAENNYDLAQAGDRTALAAFLKEVIAHAPRVHISFAADPSAAFTGEIVRWFRTNTGPTVLVQIGLQPTIAAGCVVRTANRSFDCSLRQRFEAQKPTLKTALRGRGPHE